MLDRTRHLKITKIVYVVLALALIATSHFASAAEVSKDEETNPLPPECAGPARAAKLACSPFSALGMGEEGGMMMEALVQGGGQLAAQLSSGNKNAYEQCKSAANIAKIMGAVQATRATACKVTQGRCVKACEAKLDELRAAPTQPEMALTDAIADQIVTCNGYERNFVMQLMQAMSNAQTFLGASQCAQMAKDSTTTPTPVDCKSEANAQAAVCFCELHKDDPYCMGGTRDTGTGLGLVPTNGTGSELVGGRLRSHDRDGASDGFNDVNNVAGAAPSATSAKPIAGGGSGGVSSPFGGGGGTYGGGPGAGSPGGIPTDNGPSAISGVSGGGGFSGYGSPPGDEGGERRPSAYDKLKDKFNIKNALPGRSDRSLAGMSKDAAGDGITGANGPSIWEKVSRQYRKNESTFLRAPKK